MPKKILSEKPVTLTEVKSILEARGENLDQFQRRTLDYASKFAKVEPDKVNQFTDELIKKYDIERETAVQIVNCMPSSIEELRTFFATSKKRIMVASQLEDMLKFLDAHRQK